ncbi:hypothetical protein L1049_000666 [Liquidambar formosana]|uniref:Uncharacterized protein n=1 Tax=Liquidambar formosana TaxID=63359 RepID=A0AAP0NAV5_LIQFO
MDELINSEKDVELLRLEGIIENLLGDDERVSDIFTKLADGVFEFPTYHYSEVRDHVNDHCKKRCSRWMATLRGKYFNNPWAGISTIAAGVLLLLRFYTDYSSYTNPNTLAEQCYIYSPILLPKFTCSIDANQTKNKIKQLSIMG